MAEDKVFDYSGRGQSAEPRFQNGECGIFIGSSATRADIKANSKFDIGYGMMPYWPDVKGAPQNSIIGGATLWVLRDRPREEYKGVARFFAYLSQPGVQAAWHQNTGYLPITRAAFELTRAQGFTSAIRARRSRSRRSRCIRRPRIRRASGSAPSC